MPTQTPAQEGAMVRIAIGFTAWAERWFPDTFIFVALAVVIVALGALINGASPQNISVAFGAGFWSLITFTLQMAFVVIGGYVVATSAPAAGLIGRLAAAPKSGTVAVGMVAAIALFTSLLNWGLSLIFSGLLVLALAKRRELKMDYRAAGAAAYLGLGSVWALGLSSSAAQLQANVASLPKSLLPITGVIPFTETIFLWQSMVVAAVIIVVSIAIAYFSAPGPENALTAEAMGIEVTNSEVKEMAPPSQPGEWLEHSPVLTVLIVLLGAGWIINEFARQNAMIAISNLNTYNFIFIIAGLLLHWRPRRFLDAIKKAVPATAGVMIQFPFYGAIAAILTQPRNSAGLTVSDQIAHAFVSLTTEHTYPLAIGLYSSVLGFFVPSGGGKWLLEAPYLMQAANDLKVHLGWAVQIYNAAEALPNLINPFWMLPLLGVLGLRARNIVGFTLLQLIVMLPLTLFLLWAFAYTLPYHPPVIPN